MLVTQEPFTIITGLQMGKLKAQQVTPKKSATGTQGQAGLFSKSELSIHNSVSHRQNERL